MELRIAIQNKISCLRRSPTVMERSGEHPTESRWNEIDFMLPIKLYGAELKLVNVSKRKFLNFES